MFSNEKIQELKIYTSENSQGFPSYIKENKINALDFVEKWGVTEKRSENYKYTDLEKYFTDDFVLGSNIKRASFDIDDVFKCDVPNLNTSNVIIVNGLFYEKNTIKGFQENGIWIGSIKKAFEEIPQIMQSHFGKYIKSSDGITNLNNALFADGLMLYVPQNAKLDKALQIINIQISDSDMFVLQRNLIVIEKNAQAEVLFCEHTLSFKPILNNSITEVYVGENAQYNQVTLQNEHNNSTHIDSTFVHQSANSKVSTNCISLHGGVIRNNLNIDLQGEGAENNSYGLALTDAMQHVDNNVFINHAVPHCTSNQKYKNILDHNSTGAFTGRILVSKDAQKTQAYQRSSNMLLTDTARMNARPQLEIYADDVKCSHGATVGQLDQEAMFYLRARGISHKEARMLLMFAFTHEIIQEIPVDTLREKIDLMVNQRLRGELAHCQSCSMHCC